MKCHARRDAAIRSQSSRGIQNSFTTSSAFICWPIEWHVKYFSHTYIYIYNDATGDTEETGQ